MACCVNFVSYLCCFLTCCRSCAILLETLIPALSSLHHTAAALAALAAAEPLTFAAPLGLLPGLSSAAAAPQQHAVASDSPTAAGTVTVSASVSDLAADPALAPSLAAATAAAAGPNSNNNVGSGNSGGSYCCKALVDLSTAAAAAVASAHAALAAAEQGYGDLRGFSLWLVGSLGGTLEQLLGIVDGAGEQRTCIISPCNNCIVLILI